MTEIQSEVRVWEQPVRGFFGDLASLALPGVERMQGAIRGELPRPPIYHLTGLTPIDAGHGYSTFTMPVSPWLQSTVPGLITGGVLAFLADGPLGTAMATVLPPLGFMTTSDLSLSFLRPGTLESGTLTGRARLIHGGKSVALSEVYIEDGRGRQLAHGTSRGFLMTAPGAPPAETKVETVYETPDPYLRRPVAGHPIDLERWRTITGLEALRGCVAHENVPPIYHLTGLRPTEAVEGRCTFVLPASAWLTSPAPVLYGGAIALLADAALSGAFMTVTGAGASFAPLDLKVNYLRPVAPDGSLMYAQAAIAHKGRSMAVATAELFNEDGKRIALASSSAMLLARPWSEIAAASEREVPTPEDR